MQPIITIPQSWQYPHYTLGQRTQQGVIIGLEYYAPDTQLAYEYGQGWRYAVMSNKNCEEVQHYFDDQIKLLSDDEIEAQLQAEIEEHQRQIEVLQQQLGGLDNG